MSRYLFKRGKDAKRRVVHLTTFDPRTGYPTMLPLCARSPLRFDTTSNVPWARPVCKRCRTAAGGSPP